MERSAYRLEALSALRAMDRPRGREREACDARVSRARLAAAAVWAQTGVLVAMSVCATP